MWAHFSAILSCKCTCDKSVASLLRGLYIGNSPTVLHNAVLEIHSEERL